MSLEKKIEKEIKDWEKKIEHAQLTIDRMKLRVKEWRHLLDMAKVVEGNER